MIRREMTVVGNCLLPHRLTEDDLVYLGCSHLPIKTVEEYLAPASWQSTKQVREACSDISQQACQLFWDDLITVGELGEVEKAIKRMLDKI